MGFLLISLKYLMKIKYQVSMGKIPRFTIPFLLKVKLFTGMEMERKAHYLYVTNTDN